MRRMCLVLVVCLVAGALVFTGCPGGDRVRDGETFIIATIGGPRSLDPTLTKDSASSEIMKQVFNTLFLLDFDTMEPYPSLAESFAFENDGDGNPTLLRIFLRRGVLFHNGDELRASDVKFSLDRAMVSPYISHIAGMIQGTEALGGHEVLIAMRAPFVPILHNLAHTALSIVSERAVREMGDGFAQNPVGTGPMRFVNWVVGNRIELTRWDDYWGPSPRIRDITIRYIADDATRLLELETGGVDMILGIPPQDIPRIEAHPDLQMLRRPNLSLNFIGFNMQRPPFDDLRVRQAITHAIDMDALVSTVFMGVGAPGRGPISSTVWASAVDILPQLEFDPGRARELLVEAGFPGGFSTTIVTNDNAQRIDTAVIVQNMLAQVGIVVEIGIIEWAAYLDMLDRGDHEMYILGWVTVTGDPDYGLEIFHSRSFGPGGNHARFSDPEVDRLLDAARQETDPAIRYQMYIEVQQLVHAAAPWIYTLEGETLIAARRNLRGFEINPAGHHPFWTVWFDD